MKILRNKSRKLILLNQQSDVRKQKYYKRQIKTNTSISTINIKNQRKCVNIDNEVNNSTVLTLRTKIPLRILPGIKSSNNIHNHKVESNANPFINKLRILGPIKSKK